MICKNCGSRFDEDQAKTAREYMGEHFGTPCWEYWFVCPFCNSTDIEEERI